MEKLDENGQPVTVTMQQLESIGVTYQYIGAAAQDLELQLDRFAELHGYKNRDEVNIQLAPNADQTATEMYFKKMTMFHTEHLHADDEVRYIKAGSGFFDVRSRQDEWIRLHLHRGDLIILPAGIYHRFICDSEDQVHAVRLFREDPKWTPLNRIEIEKSPSELDGREVRQLYLRQIQNDRR